MTIPRDIYQGSQTDRLIEEIQERRIARNVYSTVSMPLGLIRTRVLRSISPPMTSHDLLDPIEDAWEEDRITDRHFNRILATDLIFTARRRGGSSAEQTPVWCAVEISTTIREDDVTRARESADAIAQAVGADTIAVVAGPAIDDGARELLRTENVAFRPTPEL